MVEHDFSSDGVPYGGGTVRDLLDFLDEIAGQHAGVIKPTTARSYKSAVAQVARVVPDIYALHVSEFSVDAVLEDYVARVAREPTNHEESTVSTSTLSTYALRFRKAVQLYRDYLNDPDGFWVPRLVEISPDMEQWIRREGSLNMRKLLTVTKGQHRRESEELHEYLSYQFPLRSGQTASLELPHGLAAEDAQRLCSFILTLVIDGED